MEILIAIAVGLGLLVAALRLVDRSEPGSLSERVDQRARALGLSGVQQSFENGQLHLSGTHVGWHLEHERAKGELDLSTEEPMPEHWRPLRESLTLGALLRGLGMPVQARADEIFLEDIDLMMAVASLTPVRRNRFAALGDDDARWAVTLRCQLGSITVWSSDEVDLITLTPLAIELWAQLSSAEDVQGALWQRWLEISDPEARYLLLCLLWHCAPDADSTREVATDAAASGFPPLVELAAAMLHDPSKVEARIARSELALPAVRTRAIQGLFDAPSKVVDAVLSNGLKDASEGLRLACLNLLEHRGFGGEVSTLFEGRLERSEVECVAWNHALNAHVAPAPEKVFALLIRHSTMGAQIRLLDAAGHVAGPWAIAAVGPMLGDGTLPVVANAALAAAHARLVERHGPPTGTLAVSQVAEHGALSPASDAGHLAVTPEDDA